jgi:LacI family transcriptional regulator
MNIRSVARCARVSVATASRAINGIANVNPQLVKRVRQAVQEVGYYPNTLARSLVSGKSRIMGLIVSEITNPFFPEVVQSFEDVAVQHNYEILLTSTRHDPKRMELSIRRMIERRVDGVAVLTFGMEDSVIDGLRFRKVPLVLVDGAPAVHGVSKIRIDYQQGIRQAVQHLAALRHERIAFIAGPSSLKSALARKAAFEQSLLEIGLDPPRELLVGEDHTMEGGMRALAALAELPNRPTAVVCSNDMTAIGVIREAYERGIAIPSDLSVVGFDDIRLSHFTIPPLTTVQMSQSELGKLAFNALIENVEQARIPRPGNEFTLTTNLVLRGTTTFASGRAPLQG